MENPINEAEGSETLETPQPQEEPSAGTAEAESEDWKAQARKWESRAKENKAKADEFEEYKTKTTKELERAKARAEKAEAKANELTHANEVRSWIAEISKESGIPEAVLDKFNAETQEDLKSIAEDMKPYFERSVAPHIQSDNGVSNTVSEEGEIRGFARNIFSEKRR